MTYRYVPSTLYKVGQLAFLGEAGIRGLNYIVPNHPLTQTAWVASLSAPILVWGILFLAFALCGFFGEYLMDRGSSEHRYWPSFIAHSGLMCLYVGFAISAACAFANGGQSSFGTGFISPFSFTLMALWHWIFARRRKDV